MTQVVVRPGESDEYTIPFTYGWERRQGLGRMRRLRVAVDRAEAEAANLNPKVDKIELPDIDTVRLTDIDNGGSTWILTGYSAEWDANRAGFTPGGDVREGDDAALVTALIGEVDTWTAGTVQDLSGPLSFVFSHAHRHEALRRIETNVPGEVRFRDFGTVDYVDRLGSDRTADVTLSPTEETIENAITITDRGRELDGTHIRVLGAHEGEAQRFVNLVPEDDPATYENEVRYSTPRWTEEADTDWDRWSNKDVADQATLEEEAAALGEELAEPLVKAETVVPEEVGLSVGDTVRVVKPDADLDRAMRVHRLTRTVGRFNDAESDAAVLDKVQLSTRTTLQTDDDAVLEEIRKFNTGFQGSSVAVTGGPVVDAVDSGQPLTFGFRYPDIEFENTAEIQIRGESYRIDSQGAAAGGDHTHDVTIGSTTNDNTEYSRVDERSESLSLDLNEGWNTLDSWDPFGSTSEAYVNVTLGDFIGLSDGDIATINVRVYNVDQGEYYPNQAGTGIIITRSSEIDNFGTGNVNIGIPGDLVSDTLELQVELDYDLGSGSLKPRINIDWVSYGQHQHVFGTVTSSDGSGDHSHDPQPGIYTTGDTPDNVDVAVNGTEVATNVGSGTFETTVDIAGELTPDAWNTITISSDALGRVLVTPYVEGYAQVGGRSS